MNNNFSSLVNERLGFELIANKPVEIQLVTEAFKSALLRSLASTSNTFLFNKVYIDWLNTNGYALSELTDNDFVNVPLTEEAIAASWAKTKNIVVIDQLGEIIVAFDNNGFIINKPGRKQINAMINGLHKWHGATVYAFNKWNPKKKSSKIKYEKFDETAFFAGSAATRIKQAAVLKLVSEISKKLRPDAQVENFTEDDAKAIHSALSDSWVVSLYGAGVYFSNITFDANYNNGIKLQFHTDSGWRDKDFMIYKDENTDISLAARIAAGIIYNLPDVIIDGVRMDTYVSVLKYFKKDSNIRKLLGATTIKVAATFGDNGLKDSYANVQELVDSLKSEQFATHTGRLTGNVVLAYNDAKKDTIYVFTSEKDYAKISTIRFSKNTITTKGTIVGTMGNTSYDLTAIPENQVNDKLHIITLYDSKRQGVSVNVFTFNEFFKKQNADYGSQTVLVNSKYEKERISAIEYIADFYRTLESTLQSKFPAAAMKNTNRKPGLEGFEQSFRNTVEAFGLDGYDTYNKVVKK